MKRNLICFLLLLVFVSGWAVENPEQKQRPKVALVLCGGGAKGAAHVGALKVIEEVGLPIDMIVGTSIGGLVGGMYAMGYSAADLEGVFKDCDWNYLLSDKPLRSASLYENKKSDSKYLFRIPFYGFWKDFDNDSSEIKDFREQVKAYLPAGFLSGQNVQNYINGFCGGYQDSIDFKNLPIPFACIAVSLVSGQEVVMSQGRMPQAMRATMSIPGVFAPVYTEDDVLVDGGIVNNFPVDVAREMGADIVVGIDIQNDLATASDLKSIDKVFMQIVGLMGNEKYLENIKDVDILIKPDVSKYSTFSFNAQAVDSLMVNGYVAADNMRGKLQDLANEIKKYGDVGKIVNASAPKATDVTKDVFKFETVEVRGLSENEGLWVKKIAGLEDGAIMTGTQINTAINLIVGTKMFSSVSYRIEDSHTNHERLVVDVRKGPANVFAFGARFDSEEAAAMLLHVGLNEYNLFGSKLSLTGRLSYNPYVELEYKYIPDGFASPSFASSYEFKNMDMNIYQSDKQMNYLSLQSHKIDVNISNKFLRNFMFTLGARFEYYSFPQYLRDNPPLWLMDYHVHNGGYVDFYIDANMDSRDDNLFPTRGLFIDAEAEFFATDFHEHTSPFGTFRLNLNGAIRLSRIFTLLPAFYGRAIIGNSNSLPVMNFVGGNIYGRYFSHQLPFVGINYADLVGKSTVIGRLDLRSEVAKKHYVSAILNYMRDGENVGALFNSNGRNTIGAGVEYTYSSPIGPISLNINWSDKRDNVSAYVNIGYYF